MGDLSPHFSRHEFACHCGCGFDDVDPKLIDLLEEIRGNVNEPIIITSGCRCPYYNDSVGGVPNSAHTRGTAADIKTGIMYGADRHAIVEGAVFGNAAGIGVASTFIHVDVDSVLPRPSMWTY